MSTALAPTTTLRMPSARIACARIVEVLVPSPTSSPVRSAAWRNTCAPRFSSGSLRSNSLAIVTPSLQTSGAPHLRWIRTDFDFGPNVMRIASASWVAPRRIFSRAAERNRICLCAMEFALEKDDAIAPAANRPAGSKRTVRVKLNDRSRHEALMLIKGGWGARRGSTFRNQ